jgi:hypothetical protein
MAHRPGLPAGPRRRLRPALLCLRPEQMVEDLKAHLAALGAKADAVAFEQ